MINLSTRTRLLLIVVLAALPMLALTLYNALDQRRAAEVAARAELAMLVKLAARHQGQIIEGARQVLAAATAAYPTLRRDIAYCSRYFSDVLGRTGGIYQSMGLYDDNGEPLCAAMTPRAPFNVRDRLYFRVAQATGRFAIGEYQVSRLTGLPGINFGFPVIEHGRMRALAFVSLDLAHFQQIAAGTPLPRAGVLFIIDGKGTVLARFPEAQGQVGTPIRDPQTIHELLAGREGVFEGKASGAGARLIAVETVAQNADGTDAIRVAATMPMQVVFEQANHALARNLLALAIATLLLLLAALLGVEHFVLRSIRAVLDAARRLHSGDLSARTGLAGGRDELGQIGRTFDDMAVALQERDAQLHRALLELQQQALTDPLTKLLNRRYVSQFLPAELSKAQRRGSQVAVMMLDLDHFKRLNDTYGHDAGDEVLEDVAALLKSNIRAGDVAARWGGEEFMVVLPEATLDGAREKAELIREAIAQLQSSYEGTPLGPLTASIGIAVFPAHGKTMDTLSRAADEALYAAKAGGRNRVMVAPDEASK